MISVKLTRHISFWERRILWNMENLFQHHPIQNRVSVKFKCFSKVFTKGINVSVKMTDKRFLFNASFTNCINSMTWTLNVTYYWDCYCEEIPPWCITFCFLIDGIVWCSQFIIHPFPDQQLRCNTPSIPCHLCYWPSTLTFAVCNVITHVAMILRSKGNILMM